MGCIPHKKLLGYGRAGGLASKLMFSLVLFTQIAWCVSQLSSFKSCLKKDHLNVGSNLVVRGRGIEFKYRYLNFQWNKAFPQVYPYAYILPSNEKEVSTIVKCGKSSNIQLVQRGGGHSFTKASAGDMEKIVIDLRNIKSVSVNNKTKTGIIGAGALIGPAYYSLWKMGNYLVPPGECMTVGIAGFTLGGGYSPFSRLYGLGTDQLLSANIVTADGKLRKISKSKYPDLFWAIRGGGLTSFGVVTQFQFRLYQAPKLILFQELTYDMKDFVSVFTVFQNLVSEPYPRETYLYFEAQEVINIDIKDLSGNQKNINKIMKHLPKPVKKTLKRWTYPDFLLFSANVLRPAKKFKKPEDLAKITQINSQITYAKPKAFFVKKKIENLNLLNPMIQTKPIDVVISTETYMGAINNFKPSETAYVHRNGTIYDLVIESRSTNEESFLRAIQWMEEFYTLAKSLAGSKEVYQNYPDTDLVDYLQEYYGSNLPKLMKIKKKYDPMNYFNTPQSIPPA